MDFIDHRSTAKFIFKTSATDEKARIDDSGNILTGKTSSNFSTAGAEVRNVGQVWATRDGGTPLALNRLSSEGTIAQFYKDGGSIGVIASVSGDLAIYSSASGHTGLRFGDGWIGSTNNAGTLQNGTVSLGTTAYKFADLHLSGNANIGGNATITGDLTVNGTTTTLNTATLDVEDKNITLNYGAGDTSSTADGAGITIQDAVDASNNATILWDATNDEFDFSHAINVPSLTTTGNVSFGDNDKAIFGAGSELEIYSDGTSGIIKDAGSGDIKILADDFYVQNAAGSSTLISVLDTGKVGLGFSGLEKLATTSTGIDVTGTITFDGGTTSANLNFGDNDKAVFGAGSDLQIYHDANDSYISDQGSGNLKLLTDEFRLRNAADSAHMLTGSQGGAITAYHNGNAKLATTSSGISVDGSVVADNLTLDSGAGGPHLSFENVGGSTRIKESNSASFFYQAYNHTFEGHTGKDRLHISQIGDISFYEDTGTTAKLFWDASAESLGIGTDSPEFPITAYGSSNQVYIGSVTPSVKTVLASDETNLRAYIGTRTNHPISFVTDGDEAMRIDSSGNVQVKGGNELRVYRGDNATYGSIEYLTGAGGLKLRDVNGDGMTFAGATSNYLTIASTTGNVNIPNSSLMVGATTAPSSAVGFDAKLQLESANPMLVYKETDQSTKWEVGAWGGNYVVYNGSTERLRIDSSGQLLLGRGANVASGSEATRIQFYNTNSTYDVASIRSLIGAGQVNRGELSFAVNNGAGQQERMKLDYSGNFLVGTTSTDFNTAGTVLYGANGVQMVRSAATPLNLNRTTSDGAIQEFYKDGTAVGSVFNSGTTMGVGSLDTGVLLANNIDAILPWNASTNAERDAAIDLGRSSGRFKNLYLSSAVRWYSGSTQKAYLTYTSSDNDVIHYAAHGVGYQFWAGGNRRVDIDSSGNVGINTSSLIAKMHVKGAGTSSSTNAIFAENSSSAGLFAIRDNGDAFILGNTGIGRASSSVVRLSVAGSDAGSSNYAFEATNSSAATRFIVRNDGQSQFFKSDNSASMTITNAGNVGIGTASPNSYSGFTTLTLDGTSGSLLDLEVNGTVTGEIYADTSFGVGMQAIGSRDIQFKTNNTERMRITSGGNVGIGTSSPTVGKLQVNDSGGAILALTRTSGHASDDLGVIRFGNTDIDSNLVNIRGLQGGATNSSALTFETQAAGGATAERMRIDSSGHTSFTLGTDAMGTFLDAVGEIGSGNFALQVTNSAGSALKPLGFRAEDIRFATGSAERMRIDASGNLLVGQTSNSETGTGIGLVPDGTSHMYSASTDALMLGRGGSDGDILSFNKSGTTVGSIGTQSGNPYIGGTNRGIRFDSTQIIPADMTASGSNSDNSIDIGNSGVRFKNLYLSGTANAGSRIVLPEKSTGVEANSSIRAHTNNYTYMFGGSSGLSLANNAGEDCRIKLNDNNTIEFITSSTERTRIDASGNQLWGKTAANNTTQGIRFLGSSGFMSVVRSSNTLAVFNRIDSDGTLISFRTNGTTRGSISISGSTTSYNTTSDERAKENIVDAPSASNDIDAIKVRSFDFKADGSHQKYGMVAQELGTVAPEAVSVPDDADEMQSVDYSKLVPMMLKEIQTLRARVAQLEGEN